MMKNFIYSLIDTYAHQFKSIMENPGIDPVPLACKASALPFELIPLDTFAELASTVTNAFKQHFNFRTMKFENSTHNFKKFPPYNFKNFNP